MRSILFISAAFFTVLAMTTTAVANQGTISSYGKVFRNNDIEVQVAPFKEKNSHGLHDALIKITGAPAEQAGIDGQVILHSAVPAGTGYNFQFEKDGDMRNRMISRNAWGSWDFFQVFLNGKTYDVYVDGKKSKELKTQALFDEYKKNKK